MVNGSPRVCGLAASMIEQGKALTDMKKDKSKACQQNHRWSQHVPFAARGRYGVEVS